jgi:L-lactate dehydrogenase
MNSPRVPRVAIIGTGFVGSTTAYALLLSRIPAEIILMSVPLSASERKALEASAQTLKQYISALNTSETAFV